MSESEDFEKTRRGARLPEVTRILITGANGFVGRHLIAHLLENTQEAMRYGFAPSAQWQEHPVKIVAAVQVAHVAEMRREYPEPFCDIGWLGGAAGGQIEVAGMELNDAAGMEALIAAHQPQQIYHLAARSSGADVDRDAIFAANVQGTRALLEAASRLKPFPRVLLASTGYVYGNTDPARPARETDPIGPLWKFGIYADSKIEMENAAKAYRGLTLVARAFAHTGPGQAPAFAAPAFARQIARIERGLEPPELRVGNLDALRDMMDVRDVVRAYVLLMNSALPPGTTVNVSTGKPVGMRQIVERLCALSDVAPEIVVDPERLRPLDIACSTGSYARLNAATGWKPQYTLDTTLTDMLNFWRNMCD